MSEWLPAAGADLLNAPAPPLSVIVPIAVDPSSTCTVPVAALGDIWTLNGTLCPKADGFADDATVTVVAASLAVWVNTADVLVALFASPLYTAVIECDPAASEDTASAADPPLIVAVPNAVVPSRNCTVPVGALGVSVFSAKEDCHLLVGSGNLTFNG